MELVNSLRAINGKVTHLVGALASGSKRPEPLGLFAAEMALIRLSASFRSALILVHHGYPFEAAAICRLILEQLGWIFAIHRKTSLDEIIAVKPQSTIGKLKEFFPRPAGSTEPRTIKRTWTLKITGIMLVMIMRKDQLSYDSISPRRPKKSSNISVLHPTCSCPLDSMFQVSTSKIRCMKQP